MRTIDAVHVLRGIADICELDADNISDEDFSVIRRAASRRLATAWEWTNWPDLCRLEKRYFRPLYTAGTTYAASTSTSATEVAYHGKYYQCLRNLPLTVSSISRTLTVATVTTGSSHLLATGNQVTISGANQSDYNITATITVTGATTFTYIVANSPTTPATGTIKCTVDPADADEETQFVYWADSQPVTTGADWSNLETNALGDIRYWPSTDRYYQYYNSTSSAGNQPTNTTYWAILTDFDRYVAWAQTGQNDLTGTTPFNVTSDNPRLTYRNVDLSFSLSSNGIQVHDQASHCHIEYRQKPPQLKGDVFSATATYTANEDQIYYSATGTPGNFYDCIVTTTAGQDPDDTAASWSVVSIPYDFERYLVHGAASDWLKGEGRHAEAAAQEAQAREELSLQITRLEGQSRQSSRTLCATR
jgi:hypothetical protein